MPLSVTISMSIWFKRKRAWEFSCRLLCRRDFLVTMPCYSSVLRVSVFLSRIGFSPRMWCCDVVEYKVDLCCEVHWGTFSVSVKAEGIGARLVLSGVYGPNKAREVSFLGGDLCGQVYFRKMEQVKGKSETWQNLITLFRAPMFVTECFTMPSSLRLILAKNKIMR